MALQDLYDEIHSFAAARDRGSTPLTPRVPVTAALDSDVLLLGQGLARGTQRVTGLPYTRPSGLSSAGRLLDAYLQEIGYTIDARATDRQYVYSTDLIPWYPGKAPSGKGDLLPTKEEISECWDWFEQECALVQPRAVVLLGGWAAKHFLRRYGFGYRLGRLEDDAGKMIRSRVAERAIVAVPAYHPSSVWGKFERVGHETWATVVEALRRVLTTATDRR